MAGQNIHNFIAQNPRGRLLCGPKWSAAYGKPNTVLRLIFGAALITGFVLTLFHPAAVLAIGARTIGAIIIAMAALRICAVLYALSRRSETASGVEARHWPRYTVLVPIVHEHHMMHRLMAALSRLDYPRNKLEIIMICEDSDPQTIAAVKANLRDPFRLIIAKDSLPRTKPKALNIALAQSQSTFVTIYDAEDRPDPQQLKRAARAMMHDPKLGAVQASLRYFNADQNWLTRQFSLEYAALFEVWNPFLSRLGLPFPLGGTSNHMRRSALNKVGGWDPHNVTEDADLSFSLAAFGYRIGVIDSETLEEAVSEPRNWQRQRTRWQKGFLQSWQVHMRMLRAGNLGRFLTIQLTVGMTILAGLLHVPTVIILVGLVLFDALGFGAFTPAAPVYVIAALGYGSAIAQGATGYARAGYRGFALHVFMMPLYWLLMFIPTLLGIYDLMTRPFHWHKTRHGDDDAQNTSTLSDPLSTPQRLTARL